MEKSSIYGNWRAQVIDNKDPDKYGRVLIWIPDLMPEVDKKEGIWARPANNPIGGRNMESEEDHHFMGSSYIPKKGAWVFIFFEGGNINLPYYFGALDLENTKVLPENQLGDNYENKWTLLKTHKGRTIMISDDPDDARTEITGKKRIISKPPTGDLDSVYTIDENQTTILFDERKNREKILIRTYKGDFIHIDIDEQNLQTYFKNDINIECDGKLSIKAKGDIHIKTDASFYEESAINTNRIAGSSILDKAGSSHSTVAGTLIARDATMIQDNDSKTSNAIPANPTKPKGERNT